MLKSKMLCENVEPNLEEAKKNFRAFMESLGLNLSEPNLTETPTRVATTFIEELFSGLYEKPPAIKSFPTYCHAEYQVIKTTTEIKSLCAHHFLPITGTVDILAIFVPDIYRNVSLPGLSKYARVANYFSRRPQLQEILTSDIADYLIENTDAVIIAVKLTAKHHCMSHRGIEQDPHNDTTTVVCRDKNLAYADRMKVLDEIQEIKRRFMQFI